MSLADKLLEFQNWSTARKTALLYRFSFPTSLVLLVATHVAFRQNDAVDIRIWDRTVILAVAIVFVTWAASELTVRAGHEGTWTIYFAMVTFGIALFLLIHVIGTWHAAYLGWFPLLVVLTAIWYDLRIALIGFCWGLLLLGIGTVITVNGTVDYAPAIEKRGIDDQLSWSWVAGVGAVFFISLFFCLVSVLGLTAMLRRQEEQLHAAFTMIRRYVPGQVADALLSGPAQPAEHYDRRRLSIFFSDLVGFTDTSDELEPEDLARLLNEYFSEMTRIALAHGGTIDELSGDAILVFFGAPVATNDRDQALRAVRMAVEMQTRVAELNARWLAEGRADTVTVRMGVNTGVVTVGNFGSPERMKYAALGRHVNIASRLQAISRPGQIMLSHATWLLVKDEIPCTPGGETMLKGLHTPVKVYEVDGCPEPTWL
jgi:class 3 adenylate cyclase